MTLLGLALMERRLPLAPYQTIRSTACPPAPGSPKPVVEAVRDWPGTTKICCWLVSASVPIPVQMPNWPFPYGAPYPILQPPVLPLWFQVHPVVPERKSGFWSWFPLEIVTCAYPVCVAELNWEGMGHPGGNVIESAPEVTLSPVMFVPSILTPW